MIQTFCANGVEVEGFEPTNLLRARQTLYQLSYTPIYINDEVTSMNFVVNSLISYFNYNEDTATSLTHNIHSEGSAIVAVLPYEIAEENTSIFNSSLKASQYQANAQIFGTIASASSSAYQGVSGETVGATVGKKIKGMIG